MNKKKQVTIRRNKQQKQAGEIQRKLNLDIITYVSVKLSDKAREVIMFEVSGKEIIGESM